MGPVGPAGEALIRTAASAFLRAERCRKAIDDAKADATAATIDRWREKRRHAMRRKAQDLKADPFNTVTDLKAEGFGCEWLMRQWLQLDARLAQGIGWSRDQTYHAMNLKGFINAAPGPDADPRLREFFHLGLASGGNRRQEAPAEVPTNPAEARQLLRQRVAQEIAALDARRGELWEKVDLPRLASVAAAAALDTTKDGQLRQRYHKEAVSEMVRCLNTRDADAGRTATGSTLARARPGATPIAPEPEPLGRRRRTAPGRFPKRAGQAAETAATNRQNPITDKEIRPRPRRRLRRRRAAHRALDSGAPGPARHPLPRPRRHADRRRSAARRPPDRLSGGQPPSQPDRRHARGPRARPPSAPRSPLLDNPRHGPTLSPIAPDPRRTTAIAVAEAIPTSGGAAIAGIGRRRIGPQRASNSFGSPSAPTRTGSETHRDRRGRG